MGAPTEVFAAGAYHIQSNGDAEEDWPRNRRNQFTSAALPSFTRSAVYGRLWP